MGKQPEPSPDFKRWLAGVRDRMREARENCSLSYREAASRTGVPFASIRRVEVGEMVPTVQLVFRLAVGYGVTVAELLCDGNTARGKK